MTEERQVGAVSVVRFELEYADGSIRRLLGEEAERWKNWLDGAAALMVNHGMTPGPVSWEDIPPPLEGELLQAVEARAREMLSAEAWEDSPKLHREDIEPVVRAMGDSPLKPEKLVFGAMTVTMPPFAPVEVESMTPRDKLGAQAAHRLKDKKEELKCACGWEGTVTSDRLRHVTCPRCGVLVF